MHLATVYGEGFNPMGRVGFLNEVKVIDEGITKLMGGLNNG
jgi:hypothetical protein